MPLLPSREGYYPHSVVRVKGEKKKTLIMMKIDRRGKDHSFLITEGERRSGEGQFIFSRLRKEDARFLLVRGKKKVPK